MCVSVRSRSTPPSISARACSPNASTSSRNVTARAPGSLTSGDSEADFVVGPIEPATQRGLPSSALARSAARRATCAAATLRSRTDALEPVVGERDRRRGERVGLDDVGAGAQELEVDVLDRLGLGQREQVVAALERERVVLEPLAAPHRLVREPKPLHHRAHRAVEHDDAAVEQLAQVVDGGHRPLITTVSTRQPHLSDTVGP